MIDSRDILNMTIRRVFSRPNCAYIYVICSKHNHVMYVGQTNDPGGVCARLAGHISFGGTFRKRLYDFEELPIEEIDDLEVFAFALPSRAEYVSRDETWREGVEYNVQVRLQSIRGDWMPYFNIISNVTAPVTTGIGEVVALSQQIVMSLNRMYHSTP